MLERLQKDEQYRMTNTHPFLRDGVMATNTESRCQKLDGQRSKLLNMTRLPWTIIHTSQQDLKEFKIQNVGYSD